MIQDRFFIKKADILTREWLIGARKGWLSLLNPTINTWDDVIKAIDKLLIFVRNLHQQITFVRPAPSKIYKTRRPKNVPVDYEDYEETKYDVSNEKLDRDFQELFNQLNNCKENAKWHDYKDHDDVLKMYKNDFSGTLSAPLQSGKYKQLVSPTSLLDKILKRLRDETKEIRQVQEVFPETAEQSVGGTFKEFNVGEMKVVVTASDFHGGIINKYVAFIQKAKALLDAKGFNKAWRDKMFIQSDENFWDREQNAYTYAKYFIRKDYIVVTNPPDEDLVDTIVHEVGHRYWFKYMTEEQRGRFESFIDLKKTENDEDKFTVIPVSTYGRTNIDEAFAEAFMHYVCGKDMTRDQIDSFKAVLKKAENRTDELIKMANNFYTYLSKKYY